jgi:hypothetical protein
VLRGQEARRREAALREEWRKKNPDPKPRATPPPDIFSFRRRTLRPPDPDGPFRAVTDGFRNAVLDNHGMSGLVNSRPVVAKEVVLAVCIEEPQPIEDYMDRSPLRGLGLAHWQRGYPSLYWKGPFLNFLQQAPEEGLDLLIRLTNYATMRNGQLAVPSLKKNETSTRLYLISAVDLCAGTAIQTSTVGTGAVRWMARP